jgi:uncharacterized membrane protein HdeD (DUF308 family)
MAVLDEGILIVFLLGLSVFIFYGGKYTILGYENKAIQAGFSTSLMYFGLILLVYGAYSYISTLQTSVLSIFAIGFAVTAFGYNGFLNLEQSRRIHEIFLRSRNEISKLKYQDTLSYEGGVLLSIIMLIWGITIAVITGITSDYCTAFFGVLVIIFGISLMSFYKRKLPKRVDENLCKIVINQLNELRK